MCDPWTRDWIPDRHGYITSSTIGSEVAFNPNKTSKLGRMELLSSEEVFVFEFSGAVVFSRP